jgi:hypothetical protein
MSIVSKAKERVYLVQGEKHHIIPRSLGGNNSKDNIILLTYREHFICHLLLTKMTEGEERRKMCFAIKCMIYVHRKDQIRYVPSSKLIEIAKVRFAEARKDFHHTEESKIKIANSMIGARKDFHHTEESKIKIANSMIGNQNNKAAMIEIWRLRKLGLLPPRKARSKNK